MRIYLPEIKQKQGEALQYRFQGKNKDYFEGYASDEDSFTLVLTVRCGDDEVMVSGKFQTELEVNCARCLRLFKQPISSEVDELFKVSPQKDKKRSPGDLALETANRLTVTGEYLYLNEYIRQLFFISQINKPLCRPDCRGLCAGCGADLNKTACYCEDEASIDLRLLKLKEFRADK